MDLKTYINTNPRGAATKLAADLEISTSYLSQLAAGDAPISPQRAVQIEKETGGQVTRPELRPDDWESIWPELATSKSRRKEDKKH